MKNLVITSKLLAAAAFLALQAFATAAVADDFFATTPRLDARFGDAVNIAKAQQTLNPDASKNRNPVTGIDGKAAHETMIRYRESFKNLPAQTSAFNIGVSGGSGSSGQ